MDDLSPGWLAYRACADVPTAVFFPAEGDGVGEAAAKAVCATCPVRKPCLQYALSANIEEGVYGGVGEWTRRRMRRVQRAVLAEGTTGPRP